MQAIILVAGKGTRLRPLTETVPKCFTEVHHTPILLNALTHLHACQVSKVTLVIGYLGEYIQERVGDRFHDMAIDYVTNPIYNTTNTSYSLWCALQKIDLSETLLVLEGDVFFEKALLHQFLQSSNPTCTIVQAYNPTLDGSFVQLKEGVVVDWIHKSHRDDHFTLEDKHKTVNIHKFSPLFLQETLLPALEEEVEQQQGATPMEYVMRTIVQRSPSVHAFEVGSLRWFEIDEVEELKIAEEIFQDMAQ